MVGVIIATHGRLAEELLGTAQAMVGPLPQVRTYGLGVPGVSEPCGKALSRLIDELDTGEGVLVLVDLFGGSPSQAACTLLHDKRVEVVSGVNLPMVLKLATARADASLADLARLLTGYGQKNIVHASELVRGFASRTEAAASAPPKS
jgi:PTS system mannose-specific IIA component